MKSFPKRLKRNDDSVARGFTLVELLVVIAIIGVLVGLLLPAVQAAREAARRCSCQNNISQVSLAAHNFEFTHDHLPAGTTNPTGPIEDVDEGNHTSFLVRLLPYVEQYGAYEMYDFDAGAYAEANRPLRHSTVPTYRCPSDPQTNSNVMDTDAGSTYGPDQDKRPYYWIDGRTLTNYAGCYNEVETDIDDDNNGLLFLNSRIRYQDIRDGASNTILLGEIKPDSDSLGWLSGTRATLRSTDALPNARPHNDFGPHHLFSEGETLPPKGLGSFHPGGAHIATAGGSVRFITGSIDKELYRNLGNRRDGANMAVEW